MSSAPLSPADQFGLFLRTLFDPEDRIERRMIEGWTDPADHTADPPKPPRKRSRYLRRRDTGLLHVFQRDQFIRQYDRLITIAAREHGNNYFGVCPREGYGLGWGYACMIRTVRCLWADLDGCGPAEALERIKVAPLPPPTMLVNSGNGVHVYWKLTEPYRITDAGPACQVISGKWQDDTGRRHDKYVLGPGGVKLPIPEVSPQGQMVEDVLAGICEAIGGDEHAVDLARILRLPGTPNLKDGRNGAPPKSCTLVNRE